jgi:hypothetical protein
MAIRRIPTTARVLAGLIPTPQAILSRLARRGLNVLSDLFLKSSGNNIKLFNAVRDFYGLNSVREAADLVKFGREFAATLNRLQIAIQFDELKVSDISLNTNLADPSGKNRRYRYQVAVEVGTEYKTVWINSDELLSQDQLRNDATRTMNFWGKIYPRIAEFLHGAGRDEVIIHVQTVERRF